MSKQRKHLGEILYKKGYVSKDDLIRAIKKGKQTNRRLGEILIEKGIVTEKQLSEALKQQ